MNKHNIKLLENWGDGILTSNTPFIDFLNRKYDLLIENITDIEHEINLFNEGETEVLIDSVHGVYIPSMFASLLLDIFEFTERDEKFHKWTKYGFIHVSNIYRDDLITLSNPNNMEMPYIDYYELWEEVLKGAVINWKDKEWYLDQNGDLWIRSENYIYTDQ